MKRWRLTSVWFSLLFIGIAAYLALWYRLTTLDHPSAWEEPSHPLQRADIDSRIANSTVTSNQNQSTPAVPIHGSNLDPAFTIPPIVAHGRTLQDFRDLSTVDYMACCGLGHRLTKQSDAYYVARKYNYGLRAFWGYCNGMEVFAHLFGPQPIDELQNVTDRHHFIRLNNMVKGFQVLRRQGDVANRPCSLAKARSDVEFYRSLQARFRERTTLEAFAKQHFVGRHMIGVHIRAGNGETGDFVEKNRAIDDLETWLDQLVILLRSQSFWTNSSALFLATDTPSIIGKLRQRLPSTEIVTYEQERPPDGEGVLFGQRGQVETSGRLCLAGWEAVVADMILLSQTDIVVAARPSSFTQSMPMSMALARSDLFCEVNPAATEIQCFRSFADWCHNGTTAFSLPAANAAEYIRVPRETLPEYHVQHRRQNDYCIPRPEGYKHPCLPYDWRDFRVEENRTVTVLVQQG